MLERTLQVSTFKFTPDGQRDPNVDPPQSVKSGIDEGLLIPFSVSLRPKQPALAVVMGFFASNENSDVVAAVQLFDSTGVVILATPRPVGVDRTTVLLEAPDIAEIVITAVEGTFPLLEHIYVRTTGDRHRRELGWYRGNLHGAGRPDQGAGAQPRHDRSRRRLRRAVPADGLSTPSRQDEAIRHTVESLQRSTSRARCSSRTPSTVLSVITQRVSTPHGPNTGPVAAQTTIAEQVYFRTSAPPGIGVPALPAGTQNGTTDPETQPLTGFEDLSFYVKRTVPPVPAPEGGHQTPARRLPRLRPERRVLGGHSLRRSDVPARAP